MKRFFLIGMLLMLCSSASYGQSLFDITSPFKLWLLNNEARSLSSLSFDLRVIEQLSTPFAIMPRVNESGSRAEAVEELWELHRKYYIFLDEVQEIYTKLKRFESGKLAILLKRARPEVWSLTGFDSFEIIIRTGVYLNIRDIWHEALIGALGLTKQDRDLNGLLLTAINRLSSGERRQLEQYFAAFAALYPSNEQIKVLMSFVAQGSRSQPGLGLYVKDILHLQEVIQAEFDAYSDTSVDSLLELEKIMSDGTDKAGSEPNNSQWFDEVPKGEEDAFDIW
jgi:hypothetical protein